MLYCCELYMNHNYCFRRKQHSYTAYDGALAASTQIKVFIEILIHQFLSIPLFQFPFNSSKRHGGELVVCSRVWQFYPHCRERNYIFHYICFMLCFYRLDPENTKAMDGIQYLERDANSELDMSSIHDLRNRDSMEVLLYMIIFILFIYLFIFAYPGLPRYAFTWWQ